MRIAFLLLTLAACGGTDDGTGTDTGEPVDTGIGYSYTCECSTTTADGECRSWRLTCFGPTCEQDCELDEAPCCL